MGRQRKKQKSIVKYVANYFLMILLFLAFLMLVFVVFLSNRLNYSSIRRELSNELRKNAQYMHARRGNYVLDEEFIFQDENCIYVILDSGGKLVEGSYPQGFPEDAEVITGKLRVAVANGVDYYYQDREYIHSHYAIRCVAEQSKMSSGYDKFVYLAWVIVFFIIAVSLVVWKLLERHELQQVNQVVEVVGQIGSEKSLSKRIEYDGRFVEIASLAQANNRMLDQLEEVFEIQKRFTSDVAHELRTPITVLMAECEYAAHKMKQDDEVGEAFQVIERQTKKMNGVIVQMLNLSRLDQDKLKLNLEWIDIGEIVEAVCDDISMQSAKQVVFKTDIAPDFNVYADIGLMTILIQNLLDNAVKYGPEGGRVWIWSEETGEEYLLHIKDEGKGISKESQERIFRRFFRVEKNELVGGFGLGLSLVKRIAEKHHGFVTVESELGMGSTFTLHLPRNME
ncbi:MAG: HAMP domain-containing histidine kinase [Roseburia sp.]|nr:HAMP domain-containing histidine kinase [Roseburia sp.]